MKPTRSEGLTFMGTKFKNQYCPSCGKTYKFLALGVDLKRSSLKCQLCDSPDGEKESVLAESH